MYFHWSCDTSCLQDVLYSSDTQASLYLANLVEGTYLFQLRVTDAQARSSSATATVEVRPGKTEVLWADGSFLPCVLVVVRAVKFVPAVSP